MSSIFQYKNKLSENKTENDFRFYFWSKNRMDAKVHGLVHIFCFPF